jgi:high-affinity iron transporter
MASVGSALLMCGGLASCGAMNGMRGAASKISVSRSTCAPYWRLSRPGEYNFAIANDSRVEARVTLINLETGSLPIAGAVAQAQLTTVLPATTVWAGDQYVWRCAVGRAASSYSPVVTVPVRRSGRSLSGAGPLGRSAVSLVGYRLFVDKRLALLRAQLRRLRHFIISRALARAKLEWESAHYTWLTLGEDGDKSAFGGLAAQIDGVSTSQPLTLPAASFTGFHRIEWDLFRQANLTAAARDTNNLIGLVESLTPAAVAGSLSDSGPASVALEGRPFQILEAATASTLSGDDDYGSNTDLESLAAEVGAAREVVTALRPSIPLSAAPLFSHVTQQLHVLATLVTTTDRGGNRQLALDIVRRRVRQRLNAAVYSATATVAALQDRVSGMRVTS